MDLTNGGRGAIERMVQAYGFKTRQQLCDQLGVSKSTLATRYMRDSFPSDWVIQCALETGMSLRWIAFGAGPQQDVGDIDVSTLPKSKLINGRLQDDGFYLFDKSFLPEQLQNPIVIVEQDAEHICERQFEDVRDGKWVVDIDGEISVRELARLPVNRIRVEGGKLPFECSLTDINIIAKVLINCIK
ncbi:phage repressor protein CI [Hafnia alvei]|uniref:phage repressor protein CI n=1 Tax=Hafnia alvei TaxID=569 RepID=UPI00061D0C96|nr:phage repressor protein CI [Hafnia alvei]KKF38962.1 phage repressor protein [Hafnia alvei]MBW3474448.1 helix-turn-helix domain-containing protein [Hafnia alvei]